MKNTYTYKSIQTNTNMCTSLKTTAVDATFRRNNKKCISTDFTPIID